MRNHSDTLAKPPSLTVELVENEVAIAFLSGDWTISRVMADPMLQKKMKQTVTVKSMQWNLLSVNTLDNSTGLWLWQAWGSVIPSKLEISPEHRRMIEVWQTQSLPVADSGYPANSMRTKVSKTIRDGMNQLFSFVTLLGQLFLDIWQLCKQPGQLPWPEISIMIYESGVRALNITALVGFLIGIVLSYLSALQLKMFGAEIYIIDIIGLSVIRELGPLLAAILVAGRSGSAITAQIGVMCVTEELDALSAMGIPHSLRLVLPKVIALMIVMPLLSVWTSAAALIGGMVSAQNTLDISYQQFMMKLPDVVPLLNVLIGLGKSVVFGLMTALLACHFGFRIKPNTESLGSETTNSVVASITAVMMADATFAILFINVGMP